MRFINWTPQMIQIVKHSGFISVNAINASLALVILAIGGSYFLLVGVSGKQLSSYDGVTEPVRYSIETVLSRNHTPSQPSTTDQSASVMKQEDKLVETHPEVPTEIKLNDQSAIRSDKQPGDPLDTQVDSDRVGQNDSRDIFMPHVNLVAENENKSDTSILEPAVATTQLFVRVPVGRVRQSASKQAAIKTRVYRGERVDVITESGSWVQIHTDDGRSGWAHRMLFTKSAPFVSEERKNNSETGLIKGIRTKSLNDSGGEVFIELNDYCLPQTSIITGERPRVVSDFYGALPASNLVKRIEVNEGIILSIRLGIHSGERSKTRVVIDLLPNNNYIVDQQFLIAENIYHLNIHL